MNRDQSIWTRDFGPFIWKWLGLPMSMLVTCRGIYSIATKDASLYGASWHGWTGILGGFAWLILGVFMVQHWLMPSEKLRLYEKAMLIGFCIAWLVCIFTKIV